MRSSTRGGGFDLAGRAGPPWIGGTGRSSRPTVHLLSDSWTNSNRSQRRSSGRRCDIA